GVGSMSKHDEPYRKWKYRPIEVYAPPSVVVVSPPPTVAPAVAGHVVAVPTGPAPATPAAALAGPAEPSAPTEASATCLTKEYLETGAVMFRDVCTKEWAINSTDVARKLPAGRGCPTQDSRHNRAVN